jgi:hypothetical protein
MGGMICQDCGHPDHGDRICGAVEAGGLVEMLCSCAESVPSDEDDIRDIPGTR